jgi:hypothetical protein
MADPYRPFKKVYTAEEIKEFCRQTDFEKARTSDLVSHFRPPFSEYFTGREMMFALDNGVRLSYRFTDAHTLCWSEDSEHYFEEYYESLESTTKNVFLVQHIRRTVMPYEGITMIIDTDTELVTLVRHCIGTEQNDINVSGEICFGYYGERKQARHSWTDELCGVVLDWKYSDHFVIRHEYISLDAMLSPGEPTDDEEAYLFRKMLSASYVKIRNGLYIACFAEGGGSQFCLLIDLIALRDVGAIFGIGEKGISSYTIGAMAGRGSFGFTGEYAIT